MMNSASSQQQMDSLVEMAWVRSGEKIGKCISQLGRNNATSQHTSGKKNTEQQQQQQSQQRVVFVTTMTSFLSAPYQRSFFLLVSIYMLMNIIYSPRSSLSDFLSGMHSAVPNLRTPLIDILLLLETSVTSSFASSISDLQPFVESPPVLCCQPHIMESFGFIPLEGVRVVLPGQAVTPKSTVSKLLNRSSVSASTSSASYPLVHSCHFAISFFFSLTHCFL